MGLLERDLSRGIQERTHEEQTKTSEDEPQHTQVTLLRVSRLTVDDVRVRIQEPDGRTLLLIKTSGFTFWCLREKTKKKRLVLVSAYLR